MKHISAWEAHTGSIREKIAAWLAAEEITADDTVFAGDDGSYAIGQYDSADLDDEATLAMTDAGTVSEYLD